MFHKRDILKTVYVLLFFVTIITANNREYNYRRYTASDASNTAVNENQAGATDAPDNDNSSSESEREPVTISDGISEEVFLRDPVCWRDMQLFSNVEIPHAVDFAKAVIRKWRKVDVFIYIYMSIYYNEFEQYLDAEDILSPDEFCARLDTEHTPRNEDDKTECQTELSCFGRTNETALQYCFYEIIKRKPLSEVLDRERENPEDTTSSEGEDTEETQSNEGEGSDEISLIGGMNQLTLVNPEDFKRKYMKHMSKYVNVKPGILSPLKFCKKMEEDELS